MPFIPENPCSKMILNIFVDEESADIVFEVRDGDVSKRTFNSMHCSPVLAEHCGPGATYVSIPGVNMLYYVYGGKAEEEDLKAHAKEISSRLLSNMA
ncbi:hypothetical protein ACHAXR_001953 [Thalassiosira sp. AJA248-18]